MPYKNRDERNWNQLVRRTKVRDYVALIRAGTICEACGAQPIEFHRKEHEESPKLRISYMTSYGYSIETIDKEIAKCIPLCRKCHMEYDGRNKMFDYIKKYSTNESIVNFMFKEKK